MTISDHESDDSFKEEIDRTIERFQESRFILWNSILTVNAIIVSSYAVLSFVITDIGLVPLIVVSSNLCVAMVSACLLIWNIQSVKNLHEHLGKLQTGRSPLPSPEGRREDLKSSAREHARIQARERLAIWLFYLELMLIVVIFGLGASRSFHSEAKDHNPLHSRTSLENTVRPIVLPPEDLDAITGEASIGGDYLFVTVYNGTHATLTELEVQVRVWRRSVSGFDLEAWIQDHLEKDSLATAQDTTGSKRSKYRVDQVYRMPRLAIAPQTASEASCKLGFTLQEDDHWSWEFVSARGNLPEK